MCAQEGESGTVDLPDDEPDIVKLLMQYLYEGEYDPTLPDRQTTIDAHHARKTTHTCTYDIYGSSCREQLCPHHLCSYHCNGNCSGFTCGDCELVPPTISGTAEQLLIHSKMYEIADKYDVVGLKDLVEEKFWRTCLNFWNDPAFPVAAHHAFSTTPEHDKGLRDVVSSTISAHMSDLIKKPEIETLLTEFNGLAYGLLKMKAAAGWS